MVKDCYGTTYYLYPGNPCDLNTKGKHHIVSISGEPNGAIWIWAPNTNPESIGFDGTLEEFFCEEHQMEHWYIKTNDWCWGPDWLAGIYIDRDKLVEATAEEIMEITGSDVRLIEPESDIVVHTLKPGGNITRTGRKIMTIEDK